MSAATETGRYRELGPLGTGGMGRVTLAEDRLLGRQVALKRLRSDLSPASRRRLRREAQVGASLSHPNLVGVFDIIDADDGIVVVMEYVKGQTLHAALREGPLDPHRAVAVVEAVAVALDYVHERRLVHRDVKPGNVLLAADGQVKLADLGLAGGADLTRITASGAVLGTAGYMALEQLEGAPATPASDIHALGAMAFEMLSGRRARPHGNPLALVRSMISEPPPDLRTVWPQAPAAAADLLADALAPSPQQRPASAGELAAGLREALASGGASPPPPPPPLPDGDTSPSPRPEARALSPVTGDAHDRHASRRARPVALVGLLLAAAAVGAIALVVGSGGGGSRTAHGPALRPPQAPASPPAAAATAPAGTGPNGVAGTPVAAVESFYTLAAAQHPDKAWALADPAFRAQLAGYNSFRAQQSTLRSIAFPQAAVVSQDQRSAVVSVHTVATHVNHVDNCSGQVRLARGPSGWLLHNIAISC